MNGWIIRNKNNSNWTSCWNEWKLNSLMVGHEKEYNKDNKKKERTKQRRRKGSYLKKSK